MEAGDCWLMMAPSSREPQPHLWVLLVNPQPDDRVLIVSITTLRRNCDQTVILQPGDHPFVRHASSVFYGDSRIIDASRLEAEIAAGSAPQEKLRAQLLDELRIGLTCSMYTSKKVIEFYRARSR